MFTLSYALCTSQPHNKTCAHNVSRRQMYVVWGPFITLHADNASRPYIYSLGLNCCKQKFNLPNVYTYGRSDGDSLVKEEWSKHIPHSLRYLNEVISGILSSGLTAQRNPSKPSIPAFGIQLATHSLRTVNKSIKPSSGQSFRAETQSGSLYFIGGGPKAKSPIQHSQWRAFRHSFGMRNASISASDRATC